ncbi:MAG: hypothetical protein H6643_12625 [Caldilineaceae bacterium]|nr:hypothetical protein [Caldilineaceae bacterium]
MFLGNGRFHAATEVVGGVRLAQRFNQSTVTLCGFGSSAAPSAFLDPESEGLFQVLWRSSTGGQA